MTPKILLIDNKDSFTYNLVQLLKRNGARVFVTDGNDIKDYVLPIDFNAIVLSPGPGLPNDFPFMMNIIDKFHNKLPILGICLGHQAIAEYFGAKLYRLDIIKHGIKSGIFKTVDDKLHYRLKDEIFVGRYHSWAVKLPLPECLIAQSFTKDKILMSFKHTKYNIFGLQYHPESIITEQGDIIIQNWLKLI